MEALWSSGDASRHNPSRRKNFSDTVHSEPYHCFYASTCFFAVGISRNQYDCGWRAPWRIDLQILKICININVLSIVMAEAQGYYANRTTVTYFVIYMAIIPHT